MADGHDNASDNAAFMTSGGIEARELAPGFEVRGYLSTELGSPGLNSGSATVAPDGGLPYHTHPTGELIICVSGQADVFVVGRKYRLNAFDAIHVPDGVAHGLKNDSGQPAIMHTVFPAGTPEREFFDDGWEVVDRTSTDESVPESLVVHSEAQVVSLGESAEVSSLTDPNDPDRDVAARVVRLSPGGELDLPAENYDQSLFLAAGSAVCEVGEEKFDMASFCDTVCVRAGQAKRLRNDGDETAAVMISEAR
jgi:quercetin dioxygenase-like cupin family protein